MKFDRRDQRLLTGAQFVDMSPELDLVWDVREAAALCLRAPFVCSTSRFATTRRFRRVRAFSSILVSRLPLLLTVLEFAATHAMLERGSSVRGVVRLFRTMPMLSVQLVRKGLSVS